MNLPDLITAFFTVLLLVIVVTIAMLLLLPWISLVIYDIQSIYEEYAKWVATF